MTYGVRRVYGLSMTCQGGVKIWPKRSSGPDHHARDRVPLTRVGTQVWRVRHWASGPLYPRPLRRRKDLTCHALVI